jgi:hypothetical protein
MSQTTRSSQVNPPAHALITFMVQDLGPSSTGKSTITAAVDHR